MQARRDKGEAMRNGDMIARQEATQRIDRVKQELGERGPVWWTDGSADWPPPYGGQFSLC